MIPNALAHISTTDDDHSHSNLSKRPSHKLFCATRINSTTHTLITRVSTNGFHLNFLYTIIPAHSFHNHKTYIQHNKPAPEHQRQLVVAINCTPENRVLACLFGPDSHTTFPSLSFRTNLYSNAVFGGKYAVQPHTG